MIKKDIESLKLVLPIFDESYQKEIEFLKEYLISNNIALKDKQISFLRRLRELSEVKPKSEKELLEKTYPEYSKLFIDFPKVINNSLFVTSFSFLESRLVQIIDLIENHLKLKIKLEDFAGNTTIYRCNKYLSKVVEVELGELECDEYMELNNYQKIRNLIVHNNSSIKKRKDRKIEEQSMYGYVQREKMLSLDKQSGIFIINDYRYIDNFLNLVSRIISKIIKKTIVSLELKLSESNKLC